VLGTTHTLEDSGLLEALADAYRNDHGDSYRLVVVVAGSGEVLTMADRGDIDVVLAHSPDDEMTLVASGRAESREPVMHNDFVIAGPPADPASVRGTGSAAEAFRRIGAAEASFVSRGDESGTHRREQALWAAAGITPSWERYSEAGTGMGDALRVAGARGAYVLADRATFERFARELGLALLLDGDPALLNQYSVLVTASGDNVEGARAFARWVRSAATQQLIGDFRVPGTARALFVPDAVLSAAP
jgi:tungstate transport system substrate-binding protein